MSGFPDVFMDCLWLKWSSTPATKTCRWDRAIGVAQRGYRKMLAVSAGATEDKAIWTPVPTRVEGTLPKGRWVVRLGQVLWIGPEPGDFYLGTKWQGCVVHFYRNV